MRDDNHLVLAIPYTDNTSGRRELLEMFPAINGREYAALLPLNDDDSVCDDGGIELVRIERIINDDGDVDFLIVGISTKEELSVATAAFESFVSSDSTPVVMLADDDIPTLPFVTPDGCCEEWKVVDYFEINDLKYVALIPASGSNSENIQVHLMRIAFTVQDGVEGCEVTGLMTDAEFEIVAQTFEARVNGER